MRFQERTIGVPGRKHQKAGQHEIRAGDRFIGPEIGAIQRRRLDDIKVGRGGIREIEFSVQLLQIIRGGRDAGLRTTSTRAALKALAERGLLDPARAQALSSAYEFLRRLEHRLQYYDDQQTQQLPRTPEHRGAIAAAMDYPDWPALERAIEVHRGEVHSAFEALFEREKPAVHAGAARITAWLNDPQASPDLEGLAEDLAQLGFRDPAPVARRLIELTRSRRYRVLSSASRAKVDRLLPALVATAAQEKDREAAALRLLDLVEAIDGREAYFSLLLEYPLVLQRAAHLVARSAWAARLITRHPILLDELTRSAASFTATDWVEERKALSAEAKALAGDVERLLDLLRHYQQRQMLRLTIADIEGELGVMALSDELSALADVILDVALCEAAASLGAQEGSPGLAIVGYGKLGGKELGYRSDLDLIFLYDEAQSTEAERFARLAQRLNTWLTSYTPAGTLYDIDLRLRPDGAAGVLVSSLGAFGDYQLKRAWTWEHQALTRARYCAGDARVGARFEQLRDEILAKPRDRVALFSEIAAMRRKMRAEHARESTELKHIEGGMIDLEFSVQALVLAEGPRYPALRENVGNHTLLKRAGELALIGRAIAADAAEAYLALRRRTHEAALNDMDKVVLAPEELAPERAAVKRLWAALLG